LDAARTGCRLGFDDFARYSPGAKLWPDETAAVRLAVPLGRRHQADAALLWARCRPDRWVGDREHRDVSEGRDQSTETDCRERPAAASEPETCRAAPREPDAIRAEDAARCCRRAEALYYRGLLSEAIECAHRAFELQPDSAAIVDFCAWLFSNSGRHREAAAAYERLIAMRPGWAEGHRHASGSFAIAGDLDRAIQHAARACEIEPDSAEFAIHTGCLLSQTGLHRDAIEYFSRAARIAPGDPAPLQHLAAAALAAGEREQALDAALRAYALAPQLRANAHNAAELLLRCERFEAAAELIATALAVDGADPAGYRLLSAAHMLAGRPEAALAAIDTALALAPDRAEYHQHRGNLLHRLGGLEEAAAAFEQAAQLEPENPAPKRSQLTVYYDSGRMRDALAVGGDLIRLAPDNEEYAQAVLQVLNRRFDTLDGDYVVLGERSTAPARTPPRRQHRLTTAIQGQCRVVYALILREARTRFGDSTLGYGWALLEPILHILMLSLVFAVLMRGRPPIGTQFFIFYYTGIIPYHVFVHTSSSMTYAVTANSALLQLPVVGTFDVIVARGLLELATDIIVAAILLAGFAAIGSGRAPHDLLGVGGAVVAVWLLGCGFGFINAVINAFAKSWDKIWAQLTRVLYFCSGIFYVPGMMPDWIRDILAWNPVLQAVDWFRASFFAEYAPHWLDRGYLVAVAGLVLLAGLGLERGLRRRLYEPV
jgi:ABC-type polysaccharide/polyol phosphate export permease/Flp pilus assembly protein TadD